VIILNVHAPTEDKCDDTKDSFYDKLEYIFDQFPKYYMKMMLGYFSAWVGENILKLTIGNESLRETSDDNGIRIVNFASSEYVVKSTVFPHFKIHKHPCTSPDGKTYSQIDHVLVDRRRQSSTLDA
jgi:hypothetical protein